MMKRILLPLAAILAACSGPSENPVVEATYDYYGDTVQVTDTVSLPQILAQLQGGNDSIYATFAAPISSVCQVKGCWMQLDLGNGQEALVRFKDYGFFVPMDAATEWAFIEAADAGKSDSAIAAITEPKISFTVMASGVALVQKERVVSDEAEEHDHSSHEH
jgi:hypothetical protein